VPASELSRESRYDAPFCRSPCVADRTRAAAGQQAIDDDFRDTEAARLERRDPILRLGQRQRFGQSHPVKGRAVRIVKHRRYLMRLRGEQGDNAIRRVGSPAASEAFPNDAMLLLQVVQHSGDGGDGLRCGQQSQRMTGRGRIEDDDVVGGRGGLSAVTSGRGMITRRQSGFEPGETGDFQHRGQFVDPRQGEVEERVDIGAVEPCTVLERIAQRRPMPREPAAKRTAGVHLDGVQTAARGPGTVGLP
jgi:hypothetical protein